MPQDDLPSAAKALRDQLIRLRPELALLRLKWLGGFTAAALLIVILVMIALYAFDPDMHAIYPLTILLPLLICVPLFKLATALHYKQARAVLLETLTITSGFSEKREIALDAETLMTQAIFSEPPQPAGDRLEGSYNGVAVTLEDLQIRAGANASALLLQFRLKKPIDSHMVVLTRNAPPILFRKRFDNYGKVGAGNGVADRQLEIFASDRTEGLLLADVTFLQRFLEAGSLLKARWGAVSFLKSDILILIDRPGRLIEPPPLWQPVKQIHLYRIYEQFEVVFKMTDALRNNRQLTM
jgi:hypothetical protein